MATFKKKKKYKISEAEKEMAARYVGCPIKRTRIEVVICGKMQTECRKKCEEMNMGNGCQHLDYSVATDAWREYQEAKKG